MEKPVVDEIFELIIRGELEKLDEISRPEDAVYIRTAVSTKNDSGAGLNIDLEDITNRAPWVTPLFLGPKIYFTSASIALQNAMTGGKSNLLIDWSFSFDSNVAEKANIRLTVPSFGVVGFIQYILMNRNTWHTLQIKLHALLQGVSLKLT